MPTGPKTVQVNTRLSIKTADLTSLFGSPVNRLPTEMGTRRKRAMVYVDARSVCSVFSGYLVDVHEDSRPPPKRRPDSPVIALTSSEYGAIRSLLALTGSNTRAALLVGVDGGVAWRLTEFNNSIQTVSRTEASDQPQALTQAVMAFDRVEDKTAETAPVLPAQIFSESTTYQTQDVKQFLQKEFVVATGTFSNQIRGQALQTLSFPSALLTSNPMYTDKLAGFQGVRGTIKVRTVLNSTEMHEGALRTAFYPMKGYAGTANFWGVHQNITGSAPPVFDMTLVSYQRGVYIDVSTDRDIVDYLACPFSQAYYDLTAASNQPLWGEWDLIVEAPLVVASGTSTSVPYTVYASFTDDVQVVNPTFTSADGIARRAYQNAP